LRLVSTASGRASAAFVGAALFAAVLSGCGGGQHSARGGLALTVTERDFAIRAPKRVSAGDVVFRVRNWGPDDHELIVVRADGALPIRRDGLTVDEGALEHSEVGALEPGEPGHSRELRVHLSPGRYVLFCNMAGHYFGGMRSVLVVR
jgi:uncharacterized cupredoxin-like copper-binding protein